MIDGKRILAVIPARGGSKGIPKKNIKELAGKPLIAWTIDAASKSKYIDKCVVSTDDFEIQSVVERYGGEVLVRPDELARDDSPSIVAILHAVDNNPNFDFVVMLQPTSPLRTEKDIDGCIEECFKNNEECCVSVTEAEISPYWMYRLDGENRLEPILPINKDRWYQRQKLPAVYQLNGAVYVASVKYAREHFAMVDSGARAYVMPAERSYDIDNMIDFMLVEYILNNLENK